MREPVPTTPTALVRRYYDANTWKFLLTGGERAIHRELWAPGVRHRRQALHLAHELVLAELGPRDRRVLDLGCGVGTAALYLAQRRPVAVIGVSISPAQVRLADRFAARHGPLRGAVGFRTADFTALPVGFGDTGPGVEPGFDVAFAIESFVHADPADALFTGVARVLRPGGRLLVIDDVRVGDADDPRLDDVRTGWHARTLASVTEAAQLGAAAGLELTGTVDLSPYQRLGRPRDRFVHALQPVLRRVLTRSVWAQALVGGDALQRCHRAGLLEYRLLRFVRGTTAGRRPG